MYKSKKKGVSPVVATLLLILVAVAAAVVLYAWVSGLSAKAKSSGTEKTSVAFDIEAANLYYNGAGGNVTIYVRNIGSSPIENGTWSLYIIDPDTSAVVAENTSWTFNKTIDIGQIVSTAVDYSGTLTVGKYYIVKVVSPQGVVDQIYVKAQRG